MLLYNEDILDILDQSLTLALGDKPSFNKRFAYDLEPNEVASEIKLVDKELEFWGNINCAN